MNNYVIDGTKMELKLSGKFQVFKSAIIPQGTADKMPKIDSGSFFHQVFPNNSNTEYSNFFIVSKGNTNAICVTPVNCSNVTISFTEGFICFETDLEEDY